ncbi:metallophosphoesterase [Acerihabitans arboris]|uniref:Metallophosphoesterase n=1 Tax=Acerihabitans arboris TaxID=2691583 RepID=A0A845SIT5_9GAMM|nr:metallophosphoesterase [Acerihabitans arboris]NDL62558.1 metallophosphoesterase [Acerihabitans arboris]
MIIAQISDIHAAPDNDNVSRLDRALAWLDFIEPDVMVLSGDLIDNDWFDGYETIAARLDKRHYPAFILPGNSDNCAVMRSVLGCSYWTDDASGALHFTADMDDIRLIGLDSTVEGTSAGSVVEHLPWLEETLSSEGPGTSMLFMHHHVFQSGVPTMDHIMCRDAVKFGELLRNNPRRPIAIATGHVHRPVASTLAAIPAYICGSICPANPAWFGLETVPPADDPPSLMVHRWVNGSMASHHISV